MLGSVMANNLLLLFVFWELTGFASYLLIGFEHEVESSRSSARQALLVTNGGGLVMLAGFILLEEAAGTFAIDELIATAPNWADAPQVVPALLCVFVGAFTKSAQLPFHFWLPNAMAAPTPVSAYLHSATMVKLGVYLLARLHPAFSTLPLWQFVLVTVGGATSVWAMLLVLHERDLKRILAWSTVSSLGMLVMLNGVPGPGAAKAMVTFLLAHALYKAPLFFVAGNVDHGTGTRDIDQISGLARRMPWTAGAALLAGVSMAGLPLSFGFVAKDLVKAATSHGMVYEWVVYGGVLVSALSIAVAAVAAVRIFWHRGGAPGSQIVHEAPVSMTLPPLALASLGIVFGMAPWLIEPLLQQATYAMLPRDSLLMVPETGEGGLTLSVMIVSYTLGIGMYLSWDWLHAKATQVKAVTPRSLAAATWYDRALRAIPIAATATTRPVQHGILRGYVAVLLGTLVVLMGLGLLYDEWPLSLPTGVPSLAVGAVAVVIVLSAILTCIVRDTFVVLLVSGLIGLGSALLFVFLGAPDVAFTQFAVEAAFVVVVASVLLRVRQLDLAVVPREPVAARLLLGLGMGVVVAALLLLAVSEPSDPALRSYYAAKSYLEAHGRNVTNVIIVDFRGLDTLGEISVVVVTFLAILPLLRAARQRNQGAER
jgi:multicomponent Na+:H+ antiporter subunit A